MNTEQKARAYDEVREKIALRFGSNVAEEIFSEFEMSGDERVRKEIIKLVKFYYGSSLALKHTVSKDEILAWLEKQGTSYTKRDVDDAYVEGMAFAKDELEKQKPTWSEEDDSMFQSCIGAVATNDYYKGEEKEQIYDWLKSLKQRHTWKPTDEQMKALERCVDYLDESDNEDSGVIGSLCHDLKLLKNI